MKVKIKIPKGFRRLRRKEIIKAGDRFADLDEMEWCYTRCSSQKMTPEYYATYQYIRKVKK